MKCNLAAVRERALFTSGRGGVQAKTEPQPLGFVVPPIFIQSVAQYVIVEEVTKHGDWGAPAIGGGGGGGRGAHIHMLRQPLNQLKAGDCVESV